MQRHCGACGILGWRWAHSCCGDARRPGPHRHQAWRFLVVNLSALRIDRRAIDHVSAHTHGARSYFGMGERSGARRHRIHGEPGRRFSSLVVVRPRSRARAGAGQETIVKWELRRVLDELKGKAVVVCTTLRDDGKQLEAAWDFVGSSLTSVVLPSAKSMRAKDPRASLPPSVVDEYQIETEGVLSLVTFWPTKRRKAGDLQRGKQLFGALFRTIFRDEDLVEQLRLFDFGVEVRQAAAECSRAAGDVALCECLVDCMERSLSQDAPCDVLQVFLERTFLQSAECAACKRAGKEAIFKIRQRIIDDCEQLGTTNPLERDTLVRDATKRRLDTDRKAYLLQTAAAKKKAKTVGLLARALDEPGGANADRWMGEHVSAYRMTLMVEFNGVQNMCITLDASKVGQPKEETLITAAVNLDKGVAGWLSPQALVVESWMLSGCCGAFAGFSDRHKFQGKLMCPTIVAWDF